MRSLRQEAFKKYIGNGHVKLMKKWENMIQGARTRPQLIKNGYSRY
jgi:hypothetical protein